MISRDLLIFKDGWKLDDYDIESLIDSLSKEEHARFIGKRGLGKVKSGCPKNHGYNVGEGVCFLYRFVEKQYGCSKCKFETPIAQLNWLFRNFPSVNFDGLEAEWNHDKKKYRKERSEVIETPYFSGQLSECIQEVSND